MSSVCGYSVTLALQVCAHIYLVTVHCSCSRGYSVHFPISMCLCYHIWHQWRYCDLCTQRYTWLLLLDMALRMVPLLSSEMGLLLRYKSFKCAMAPVARAPETELKPESPMALKERSRVLQDASAPLHFYNNCTILSHNELTQLHTYSAAYCVRFWSAFCTGAGLPGFPLSPMELHFGSAPVARASENLIMPSSPILLF